MNSDMSKDFPTFPASSPKQSEHEDVEIAVSCSGVYEKIQALGQRWSQDITGVK